MITADRIGRRSPISQRDNLTLANVLTTVDKSSVICMLTAGLFSSLYPQPSFRFIPIMSHYYNMLISLFFGHMFG